MEDRSIHIYISSPADVKEEVDKLLKALGKAKFNGYEIHFHNWQKVTSFKSNRFTPQEQLNEKVLPAHCDLFYAIFSRRFGELDPQDGIHRSYKNPITEDGLFRSGSEFEIYNAYTGYIGSGYKKPEPAIFIIKGKPLSQTEHWLNPEFNRQVVLLANYLKPAGELNKLLKELGFIEEGHQVVLNEKPHGEFHKDFIASVKRDIKAVIKSREAGVPASKRLQNGVPGNFDEATNSILVDYIAKLIKDNFTLELTGFGKLSVNPTVNLEQVFVALKADKTAHFEIRQTQELNRILREQETFGFSKLNKSDQNKIDSNDLQMLGLRALSSFSNPAGRGYKFDEVIREVRWSMILGDPGGGKTTLVRWITLKMAKAYADYLQDAARDRLRVPANQIDPDNASDELVDLGRVRMPILVQIAHYASWAETKKQRGEDDLTLWDYIGYHQGPRGGLFIDDQGLLKETLLHAIIKANALVILDGMDEIPQTLAHISRKDIAYQIKLFKESKLEKYNRENAIAHETPVKAGGNQLIVTSRITGYETAVVEDLMHLIIQPMSDNAIRRFCQLWMIAEFRTKHAGPEVLPEKDLKKISESSAALIDAIFNHNHKNIQKLASNPLLLTVIALVFKEYAKSKKDRRLPERRVELYQRALEILIGDWKDSKLDVEEIMSILMPLANHIHSHYPDGNISDRELQKHLRLGIKAEQPESGSEEVVAKANTLFREIQEKVGLIYPRGQDLFAFLHLTFQEYLAGLYLLKDRNAQQLTDKIYDPRWREPLLLSLGYLAWKEKDKITGLVDAILESDKAIHYLMPQGAFIVVAALPGLEGVNDQGKDKILEILLRSYNRILDSDFSQIQTKIELCILNLKKHISLSKTIEKAMVKAIGDPLLAASTAILAERLEFLPEAIVSAIMKNLDHDSAELNWPMQDILMTLADCPVPKYATPKPVPLEEAEKVALREKHWQVADRMERYFAVQQQLYELQSMVARQSFVDKSPIENIAMKRALQGKPLLLEQVVNRLDWLKLMIAFYGGYTYYKKDEIEREYAEIATLLQQGDARREQLIEEDPAYYLKYNGGFDDIVYSLAVYLDTGMQKRMINGKELSSQMTVAGIFKDTLISKELYNLFSGELSSAQFIEKLSDIFKSAGEDEQPLKADAFIALMILGAINVEVLKLQEPAFILHITKKLQRIKKQLQDAVAISRRNIWEDLKANFINTQKGADILLAFQQVAIESSSVPVAFDLTKLKKDIE